MYSKSLYYNLIFIILSKRFFCSSFSLFVNRLKLISKYMIS